MTRQTALLVVSLAGLIYLAIGMYVAHRQSKWLVAMSEESIRRTQQ